MNRFSNCLVAAAATAWALVVVPATGSATELVTNGGFETGDFTGWATIPAAAGSFFDVTPTDFHTGQYSTEFGATSIFDDSIAQSLPTVAGQTYTVDFWLKVTGDSDEGANDFTASWDGNPLLALTDAATFDWTEFTYPVTATGPVTTIQFSGRNPPSFYDLDDVSVTTALDGASPTPEPATLVLATLGLASLGISAWRRRRRT